MRSDIGPYTIVPEWLLERDVSHGAVALYVSLGLHADRQSGECWPSRARLAAQLNVSKDSVDRYLRELVQAGAILKEERNDPARGRQSNRYLVVFTRRGGRTDTAGASREDAAQNQNQFEPEPRTILAPTARKRDFLFEALLNVCAIAPDELTQSGRGAANRACRDIREAWVVDDWAYEDVLEEVMRRAGNYGAFFPDAALTPSALAKHWGQLGNAPRNGHGAGGAAARWLANQEAGG